MTTIFPGWYTGRTTHVHIAAHINGTISSNGNFYSGGLNPHIGQLFFPESTLKDIQGNSHYTGNNNTRTLNSEDNIYSQGSATGLNPEMAVHYITKGDINAGIVATMVVGIDVGKNYSMSGPGPDGNGGVTVPDDINATGNKSTTTSTSSPTAGAAGEFTIFEL